jgi:sugar (pentulose or hexulose) kinase
MAGPLQWDVARDLGLPPAIPVAVGAQDQKSAALAAGLEPGVATVSLGTSTAITALVRRPTYAAASGIPCFPYLNRGQWVLEAPLATSGGAYRWLRDLLRGAGAGGLHFERMDALAAASPPGSGGVHFLPFLAGAGAPHWRAEASGLLAGLRLDGSVGDVARAVLEGVAFEIRSNLEAMARQGVGVECLRVFGGGARSRLWTGIIGSVTGLPVEQQSEVEAASRGAAILAFTAAGLFADVGEAARALRQPAERAEATGAGAYEEPYRAYCQRREAWLRFGEPPA